MRFAAPAIGLGALLALTGCDAASPEGSGRLTLHLAGLGSAAAAAPADPADLVIATAEVVARKIRLRHADGACPAPDQAPEESPSSDESSECPPIWLEPTLLQPPVDDASEVLFSVDLPEGTYRELHLQIHKPSSQNGDAVFLADHPDFDGVSVRVTGTVGGLDFVFEADLTAVITIPIDAPLEIDADTPANVTLSVDVASWFIDGAGDLLDPIDPSQQVRAQIMQNIRGSLRTAP